MKIRHFIPNDAPLLRKLFHDTVHTINAQHYTPEQLDAWAPTEYDQERWQKSFDNKICYVAEKDGELIGFIDLAQDGYLDRLFVHKNFQGQGVAWTLFKLLEKEARVKNITTLTTEASITAKTFFEKQGFIVVREQQKLHNGSMFINYLMQKAL